MSRIWSKMRCVDVQVADLEDSSRHMQPHQGKTGKLWYENAPSAMRLVTSMYLSYLSFLKVPTSCMLITFVVSTCI